MNEQVKTSKAKSSKLYEIIRLQNAIVFDLDNEPILGVDAPYSALQGSSSIALNLLAWMAANKKKCKGLVIAEEVSKDLSLLANSLGDSTKELAQALILSDTLSTSAIITPEPLSILSRAGTDEQISMATKALNKKIASMEARLTKVQSSMEACLNKV